MANQKKDTLFPVLFDGHTLKYEVECLLKMFYPSRKFEFIYNTPSFSAGQQEGALLIYRGDAQGSTCQVTILADGTAHTLEEHYPPENPAEQKAVFEYRFCALLFRLLCPLTGITPSWGLLTGIRPVKKIQQAYREGTPVPEILQHMEQIYYVQPEKLRLTYQTMRIQEPLLAQTPAHSASLYLSIPFCPSRCSYCSFVSHSVDKTKNLVEPYITQLCKELEIWQHIVDTYHYTIDTVYIGGGTPTTLTAQQLDRLLGKIAMCFDLSGLREYCVEAGRPDTITPEKLDVLRKYHIDRISVNPQTMSDKILEAIGRRHTAAQTVEAYEMVRAAGFESINMDLIAGLPGDTPEQFSQTLEKVFALDPQSITVHALTLKRAAALFPERTGQIGNPAEEMLKSCRTVMADHGYYPYYLYRQKNTIDNLENVGYAKPGHESLYNILIMDESQSIFGAGCGASTKLVEPCGRITRIHNYKFPYEYIGSFDKLMQKKDEVRAILQRMNGQEEQ